MLLSSAWKESSPTHDIQAQWNAELVSGAMNSSQWPELGYTKCENGFAAAIPGSTNDTFRCNSE